MAIIIGGSPSTGSSLLRRILNRNSAILCGEETSVLTKEALYLDWSNNKNKLLSRSYAGLSSMGWHHLIGLTNADSYGLQQPDIQELIESSSDDLSSFVNGFFARELKRTNKSVWAEKTPANAFAFKYFLDLFPNAKVIQTVREPFDTISSLYNRGVSILDAVSLYLLNTAAGLELISDDRFKLIKYEDLVSDDSDLIPELCAFLNVQFEAQMLEAEASDGSDHMKGWAYKETDKIQKGSVGRFQRLDETSQKKIIAAVTLIKSKFSSYKSIYDLANVLGYKDLPGKLEDKTMKTYLNKEIAKDKLIRTAKGSYFNITNYPIYVD